jgi:hypothetical protein
MNSRRKKRVVGAVLAQVIGYRVNFEWLVDFSVRHGINAKDDSKSCLNAVMKIVRDAQIDTVDVVCVKWDSRRSQRLCVLLSYRAQQVT